MSFIRERVGKSDLLASNLDDTLTNNLKPVGGNESPPRARLLQREDGDDEKDDDCDDDDDEKKCKTRSMRKTSSATSTETSSSTQLSAPIPPGSTSSPQASPPISLPSTPSTLPVAAEPSSTSQVLPPSSTPNIVASTSAPEASNIPSLSQQSTIAAAPTLSRTAVPATSAAPPPTQASNSNNAGRTAGIVFLILGFFAFFAALFFYRRWRNRRKQRTEEKAKGVMDPAAPPSPPPARTAKNLPPLTSNPPMVSLPPPPPAWRSGQDPSDSSFTPSSSMFSSQQGLGPQSGPSASNTRSAELSVLASREEGLRPPPVSSGGQKPRITAVPSFVQSAIDRRAKKAEMAQAGVESWPPSPDGDRMQPKIGTWKGLMSRSSSGTASRITSPRSFPSQNTYSSTSHESLILPMRSSMSSDASSLSSGWGDGPTIPTPVLVMQRPSGDRKVWTAQVIGREVGEVKEVAREVV